MNSTTNLSVFDGHNDVLLSIYLPKNDQRLSFFDRNDHGHIDLPRMRQGGLAGGFFAVFVPSQSRSDKHPGAAPDAKDTAYELPMPASVDQTYAREIAIKGMASLFRLAAQSNGQISVVRTTHELDTCLQQGSLAAVLHFEGAEAIDTDLDALYVFYQAGLRSLGPAWSRANAFAEGVPFKFPHSPDTGPGLSEAGKELVKACNQLGIMIDLSHINEKGFWDVANLSDAPLVVTHAGAWELCQSTRNLTDKQLDAIGESKGVVGVNFHVAFLRADGRLEPETPLTEIVRHIDYIADRIGIDHVALGSDFDGATMPLELGDVSGIPKLLASLQQHGYDDKSLRKLASENWIRLLGQTWKE